MEFVLERQPDHAPVAHLTFEPDESLTVVADALALARHAFTDAAPGKTDGSVWIHGTNDARRDLLESEGFTSNRTLLQMRRPLPADTTAVATRAFTADDVDAFVEVNNRAFHWHPEQSGLTPEAVRRDMEQPWFDPDGFRLHHVDDKLAGFCWTKIHTDPERLGEIYVIAVDPDFHGQGLGKALTLAGLTWLSDQGLDTGMLYVESDNEAAVATYERIGFHIHRYDTMWVQS